MYVLKSLFVVTFKLGFAEKEVERVWELVGKKEANVGPVLSFLFDTAVISQNRQCVPFCKQVALFVGKGVSEGNHFLSCYRTSFS